MKKYLFLLLSIVFCVGCSGNGGGGKHQTGGWSAQKFGEYTVMLPSKYSVQYLNQTRSMAVLISEKDSIYLTTAFLDPSFFDNYGEVLEKINRKSVKGEFFFKPDFSNIGTAGLFFYDTLNKTNWFGKTTKYYSILLIRKNSNRNQLDTLKKIFMSVSSFPETRLK